MAKGYIVYVDGKKKPAVVHKSLIGAYNELERLARKHPGKEVWLLRMQKRIKADSFTGRIESCGSHTPPNGLPTCHIQDLITGEKLDSLKEWKSSKKEKSA